MVQEIDAWAGAIMPTGATVFSKGAKLSERQIEDMLAKVAESLPSYAYGQYKHYPSKKDNTWEDLILSQLNGNMMDSEWTFFFEMASDHPNLIGCRVPKWDEDHFGFRMASINVFISRDGPAIENMVGECLDHLRGCGVKFVSSRINGDNIALIHLLESNGFRYYENIIWPVLKFEEGVIVRPKDVRLMTDADIERVVEIAGGNSFPRSHFHCDTGFSKEKVNSMPAKWVKTAWKNKDPIAVIESDGEVAGYFAFKMDKTLSETTGYNYARMRHLALDSSFRGKGLGKRLFGGTIALMGEMGAEYIDSGYSSKNHMSARLHVQHSFESVYEEVTLHLWL